MERKQREWKWAADNDMEIDGPSGLEVLTEDEILFMAGYVEHMFGEESRQSA